MNKWMQIFGLGIKPVKEFSSGFFSYFDGSKDEWVPCDEVQNRRLNLKTKAFINREDTVLIIDEEIQQYHDIMKNSTDPVVNNDCVRSITTLKLLRNHFS